MPDKFTNSFQNTYLVISVNVYAIINENCDGRSLCIAIISAFFFRERRKIKTGRKGKDKIEEYVRVTQLPSRDIYRFRRFRMANLFHLPRNKDSVALQDTERATVIMEEAKIHEITR